MLVELQGKGCQASDHKTVLQHLKVRKLLDIFKETSGFPAVFLSSYYKNRMGNVFQLCQKKLNVGTNLNDLGRVFIRSESLTGQKPSRSTLITLSMQIFNYTDYCTKHRTDALCKLYFYFVLMMASCMVRVICMSRNVHCQHSGDCFGRIQRSMNAVV